VTAPAGPRSLATLRTARSGPTAGELSWQSGANSGRLSSAHQPANGANSSRPGGATSNRR